MKNRNVKGKKVLEGIFVTEKTETNDVLGFVALHFVIFIKTKRVSSLSNIN